MTIQPSNVFKAMVEQIAGERAKERVLKRNWGGEASKGVVEKAGQGLWWRRWGERSKVSPPSDISCAREAVTTRSAEVQVSERDDWLTRPLLRSVPVGPFILPSLPLAVTPPWPSPPFLLPLPLSSLSVYPQTPPNPVILSSFSPSFPPTHLLFHPLS